MEKIEVKLKCTGCGHSIKLKVPVSDKPVNFKCPKCEKVLKVRVPGAQKDDEGAPPPDGVDAPPGFETTQLPDDHYDFPGPASSAVSATPASMESEVKPAADDARWTVRDGDAVKGPFVDHQVLEMIVKREISADTPMRIGQRPWIPAGQVSIFKPVIERAGTVFAKSALAGVKVPEVSAAPPSAAFYGSIQALLPYPLAAGNFAPLGIFAGIAFVISAVLCITPEFGLLGNVAGLLINVAGWMILFGYLAGVMRNSMTPGAAPPNWDFGDAKGLLNKGARIFAVLLVYSLIPVTVCLLLMCFFFLTAMPLYGWICLALVVVFYAASLFLIPASLTVLGISGRLGLAMHPLSLVAILRYGGRPYFTLVGFSRVAGMLCFLVTLLSVFLVDVKPVGFALGGLVMAIVFSYGHFLWFHILGRYSGENGAHINQALADAHS
jgi:predicted RNA-binding Zn-ribbon protein involved in translation (DUF1610 family)